MVASCVPHPVFSGLWVSEASTVGGCSGASLGRPSKLGTGRLGLVSGSPSEALTVGQALSGGALGKLEPIKHLTA